VDGRDKHGHDEPQEAHALAYAIALRCLPDD
jgi:hypothetical protein